MTIVTDGLHVTSTTSVEELHDWAEKNNILRHWFRGVGEGCPYYCLPKRKLILARKLKQVRTKKDILAYGRAIALVFRPGGHRDKSKGSEARSRYV